MEIHHLSSYGEAERQPDGILVYKIPGLPRQRCPTCHKHGSDHLYLSGMHTGTKWPTLIHSRCIMGAKMEASPWTSATYLPAFPESLRPSLDSPMDRLWLVPNITHTRKLATAREATKGVVWSGSLHAKIMAARRDISVIITRNRMSPMLLQMVAALLNHTCDIRAFVQECTNITFRCFSFKHQ